MTEQVLRARNPERQLRENVATMLHRTGLSKSELALAVGMSQPTMSRRTTGGLPWLYWEVEAMAEFFGLTLAEMTKGLPSLDEWEARGGLRACRDSNPKPSDLYLIASGGVRVARTLKLTVAERPALTLVSAS